MPLVRIALREGRDAAARAAIGDAVHQAMVETLKVPAADRFQVVTTHSGRDLVQDPDYLDIPRSENAVFIQVTLNTGRTVAMKQAFYASVAARLVALGGIRAEDILINLIEVPKENWSFGMGVAQYADPKP